MREPVAIQAQWPEDEAHAYQTFLNNTTNTDVGDTEHKLSKADPRITAWIKLGLQF